MDVSYSLIYVDKNNDNSLLILKNEVKTSKEYLDCKQHNPDGSVTSGGKVNTGAALYYTDIPAQRYYTASNCDGYLLRTYGRILIRKKVGI